MILSILNHDLHSFFIWLLPRPVLYLQPYFLNCSQTSEWPRFIEPAFMVTSPSHTAFFSSIIFLSWYVVFSFLLSSRNFFWGGHMAHRILVARPGIKPTAPAVGTWSSKNWTIRESPTLLFTGPLFKFLPWEWRECGERRPMNQTKESGRKEDTK